MLTAITTTWVQMANGDVWSDSSKNAKPVLYQVGGGWMVAGIRTARELAEIARLARASA